MSLEVNEPSRQRRLSVGYNVVTLPEELTFKQVEEIKRCFDIMDLNKDGRISKSEVVKAAQLLGMNPTLREAEAMISAADIDKDGFINFEEYIRIMKEQYVSIDLERERLKAAFAVIDTNKDGFISQKELQQALTMNNSVSEEELRELQENFATWDTNGDGQLDYGEFVESTLCATVFHS